MTVCLSKENSALLPRKIVNVLPGKKVVFAILQGKKVNFSVFTRKQSKCLPFVLTERDFWPFSPGKKI